jgi:plastocyanin
MTAERRRRPSWRAAALVALALAVAPAAARADGTGRVTGTVKVVDADGSAVAPDGVIVYVVGFTEPPPAKAARIAQKDKRFVPDLVAVTAGQDVVFPNNDALLHNVFSRSATRPFDLGQYKRGEAKAKAFPKPGVVDVYCNIHPEMAATIVVVPNRAHTVVGADGTFTITGVPPGTWTVFAYTRLAVQPGKAEVTVAAGADATVGLEVTRGPATGHRNKYGEAYRDPTKYR